MLHSIDPSSTTVSSPCFIALNPTICGLVRLCDHGCQWLSWRGEGVKLELAHRAKVRPAPRSRGMPTGGRGSSDTEPLGPPTIPRRRDRGRASDLGPANNTKRRLDAMSSIVLEGEVAVAERRRLLVGGKEIAAALRERRNLSMI